jgi:hypothetical protein
VDVIPIHDSYNGRAARPGSSGPPGRT